MTVGDTGTTTFIGVITHIISQILVLTTLSEVMVPPPQVKSIPVTPRVTQALIEDPKTFFIASFTLPSGSREYPYDTPTTIIAGLKTNEFTYVDNEMTIASPLNPYLASGFAISNPSRTVQP